MKKGKLRTVKRYSRRERIKYAIEVKINGAWRQGVDVDKRRLIFDCEYDACAKMLSFFERRIW